MLLSLHAVCPASCEKVCALTSHAQEERTECAREVCSPPALTQPQRSAFLLGFQDPPGHSSTSPYNTYGNCQVSGKFLLLLTPALKKKKKKCRKDLSTYSYISFLGPVCSQATMILIPCLVFLSFASCYSLH